VLGANEVVPEAARFLASQDDDPSRPLGEPFEHFSRTPFAGRWAPFFTATTAS